MRPNPMAYMCAVGSVLMTAGLAFGTTLVEDSPPGFPNLTDVMTVPSGYLTDPNTRLIEDGLPTGSALHGRMVARVPSATSVAGGDLGGEQQQSVDSFFDIFVDLGTGALAGYQRAITLPMTLETHTGPRSPGAMQITEQPMSSRGSL